jgi:hypothetical protein
MGIEAEAGMNLVFECAQRLAVQIKQFLGLRQQLVRYWLH